MKNQNVSIPVIAISGPTASGKSAFSIQLAKRINAEIINADSVQVYEGLDIGSGKLSLEEREGIVHHLISHVSPVEQYSAGRFRKEALSLINDIHSRGKVSLIVGGTGLYLSTLFGNFLDNSGTDVGEKLLSHIEKTFHDIDLRHYYSKWLKILDPEGSAGIPESDFIRTRRALLLVLSFGCPLNHIREKRNVSTVNPQMPILRPLVIILEEDRNELNNRINERVVKMFKVGWVKECSDLLRRFSPDTESLHQEVLSVIPACKAIGYRHLSALDYSTFPDLPEVDNDLIKQIQRDTRSFAKRQRTWWRHSPHKMGWSEINWTGSSWSSGSIHSECFNSHSVMSPVEKSQVGNYLAQDTHTERDLESSLNEFYFPDLVGLVNFFLTFTEKECVFSGEENAGCNIQIKSGFSTYTDGLVDSFVSKEVHFVRCKNSNLSMAVTV
ncbi:MAG TPA: tRNA (adenosine(37)-N6)-dimethylallyltransferase MiaA [Oligoflexia bacterium]|nr:tRNA (adenosine(37)-N6)-dimethylallyltransferase MiaA [Oligoflexia bacterium]HMP49149.1 tRNA (adenosine(37)-N6)-dimethylallyltransferase MiaA [Oligoflexia bacterium]